ncbi:hypothetical protein MKX03_001495, partial [Papaver bracteatum]
MEVEKQPPVTAAGKKSTTEKKKEMIRMNFMHNMCLRKGLKYSSPFGWCRELYLI